MLTSGAFRTGATKIYISPQCVKLSINIFMWINVLYIQPQQNAFKK